VPGTEAVCSPVRPYGKSDRWAKSTDESHRPEGLSLKNDGSIGATSTNEEIMTVQAATPYLILHGKADQAIEFYRTALGATPEALIRFGDVDGSCPVARQRPCPPGPHARARARLDVDADQPRCLSHARPGEAVDPGCLPTVAGRDASE